MFQLASVDPGAKYNAIAIWDASRLHFLRSVDVHAMQAYASTLAVHECVVETQHLSRQGSERSSDILDVAFQAGFAAASLGAQYTTKASVQDWKRNTPKRVSCIHSWEGLDAKERAIAERAIIMALRTHRSKIRTVSEALECIRQDKTGSAGVKIVTDLLDAVGIGLWALKSLR